MTFAEVPHFISKSIDQSGVSELGYCTDEMIPFARLESGLKIHGSPLDIFDRSGAPANINQCVQGLTKGLLRLLNDISLRYYGRGRDLLQHSRYEYKPGDIVLELGAYHGYYSLRIAEQIGPSGTLIPVEFVPGNYSVLALNMEANFPDRAIPLNVGIDSRAGTKEAFVGSGQVAGFQEEVITRFQGPDIERSEVETDTVDNIITQHGFDSVDMVVVQVNGHEAAALEGMQKSLKQIKNMAIASPYNSTDPVSQMLIQSGFEVEVEDDCWVYATRTGFSKNTSCG